MGLYKNTLRLSCSNLFAPRSLFAKVYSLFSFCHTSRKNKFIQISHVHETNSVLSPGSEFICHLKHSTWKFILKWRHFRWSRGDKRHSPNAFLFMLFSLSTRALLQALDNLSTTHMEQHSRRVNNNKPRSTRLNNIPTTYQHKLNYT